MGALAESPWTEGRGPTLVCSLDTDDEDLIELVEAVAKSRGVRWKRMIDHELGHAMIAAPDHRDLTVSPFQPTTVRRAIEELLRLYPSFDIVRVDWQTGSDRDPDFSPWVLVDLGQPSEGESESWAIWPFAIWKRTGAVHSIDHSGAVSDDPLIELEAVA